jgi:hypothetical protein
MIKFQAMLGRVHHAELRDSAVFIDNAQVVGLDHAPNGHGISITLRGETWPIHVEAEQLQALAPIAAYLPRTYLCWDCQRPILYLDGPPPDEPICPDCAQRETQQSAVWEAQRAQQRGQIVALEQLALEALYAEAKAQVAVLAPQSAGWRYWRQVQLDASAVIVARRRG